MDSASKKKRDDKKARKEEERAAKALEEEVKEPPVQEEEEDQEDALDYSSNEEEQLEKSKSLQRVEPRLPKTFEEKQTWPRVIVILEYANLETAKTKRGIELINCDDH